MVKCEIAVFVIGFDNVGKVKYPMQSMAQRQTAYLMKTLTQLSRMLKRNVGNVFDAGGAVLGKGFIVVCKPCGISLAHVFLICFLL